MNIKPLIQHAITALALMAWPLFFGLPGAAIALGFMWWERERTQHQVKHRLGFKASVLGWSRRKHLEWIVPVITGGLIGVIGGLLG